MTTRMQNKISPALVHTLQADAHSVAAIRWLNSHYHHQPYQNK